MRPAGSRGIVLLLCLGVIAQAACAQPERSAQPTSETSEPPALSNQALSPLPVRLDLDPKKVDLGQKLFNEPRLSHDNSVSCASCHTLATGGTDRHVRSVGIGGQVGARNAPTVFNSGFNFRQFWDGRAETLEAQAAGPIHNPVEMGSNWPEVISKLRRSPVYMASFSAVYADGITSNNVADAIATYERSLYTPNSRFDQFLRGDEGILTEDERSGYRLFQSYGCVSCHQGINVGGNMYQRFGVMAEYLPGFVPAADPGRFAVTGDERDRQVFKVPALRNVAVTAPYFHDGSAPTLAMAVAIMGRYQLGRSLSGDEVDRIVAFLNTLTGEYNGQPLT